MLVTTSQKTLEYIFYIRYPIQFFENSIKGLIHSKSEVDVMNPGFIQILSLIFRSINIRAQKIDKLLLKTYGIVSTSFLLQDNLGRVQFFKETFLFADINIEVVLKMLFLFLSDVSIKFDIEELIWRRSTIIKAMATVKKVQLIYKFEFVKVTLSKDVEIYIVHVNTLEITGLHLSKPSLLVIL